MDFKVSLFEYLEQMYHGEILISVKDSTVAFANKAFCKMIGTSLDKLRTMKDISKLFHPTNRQEILEAIQTSTPLVGEHELRLIDSSGDIIWTKCSSLAADFEGDSKMSGKYLQFSLVDISNDRAILDNLPDMVFKIKVFREDVADVERHNIIQWLKHPSGHTKDMIRYINPTLMYLNEAAVRTLQYGTVGVREKSLQDIINLDDMILRKNILKVVFEGSRSSNVELINSMGQKIPCEMFCTLDMKQFPLYIYGVVRNVSEHHEREVIEDTRFKAVVEDLDCLVCRFTPDFILTFVNKRFAQYVGQPAEELIGTNYLDRVPGNIRQSLKTKLSQINSDVKVISNEHMFRDRKGRSRIYSWTDHGIFVDGQLKEVQAVGRDVTEVRQIQRQKRFLKKKIKEQEKNLAIVNFSQGLYTIINNRLQRVTQAVDRLGYADEGDRETERKTAIKEIQGASESVKELIHFYEPVEIIPHKVAINNVIGNALGSIYKNIDIPSNIIITSVIEASNVLNVDASQIIDAVEAIARNAIEAMAEEKSKDMFKLQIHCGVSHVKENQIKGLDSGSYVLISISDNGPGVNEKVRDRIFEPFVTTKTNRKVGIGLSMAQRVITDHDGHIFISPVKEKGTQVEIYLPLESVKDLGDVRASYRGSGETILIVDDDEAVADYLKDMLELSDYVPLIFSSGEDALTYFKESFINVNAIVLDLVLPDMTGQDCLKEILTIDEDANVIIGTGSGNGQHTTLVDKGAKYFINKPYTQLTLLKSIYKTIHHKA